MKAIIFLCFALNISLGLASCSNTNSSTQTNKQDSCSYVYKVADTCSSIRGRDFKYYYYEFALKDLLCCANQVYGLTLEADSLTKEDLTYFKYFKNVKSINLRGFKNLPK